MREVNRGLIVLKPKQPFLDWIKSVDDHQLDLSLNYLHDDASAYLIPEWEDDSDHEEILNWCAKYLFEVELWGWYTDESLWPKKRDLETFRAWFDVEFHSLVFDVSEDRLEHIDYDSDVDDDIIIDTNSNGH
jgi:hypothetical protein